MKARLLFIVSFFIILFGLLEFRLYNLQVLDSEQYVEKANALTELQSDLFLGRGQILFTDRHGNKIPIALTKEYPVIYSQPKEIKNVDETAEKLSPLLGLDAENIKVMINNPKYRYRLLVEKPPKEMINSVVNLKLPGIDITYKDYREYPFQNLAAQLIGFVGVNTDHPIPTGLYGLEKLYNQKLKENNDIQLTIDRNIQAQSEVIIKKIVTDYNANQGTVIVMEPKTGKILALANFPNFDPNNYKEAKIADFLNSAVQSRYEPGSVFKPITMAAGIDKGLITPETTFFDKGSVTLNEKTITNWDHKAYGKVTMTKVIEKSINTGAVFAVQKIGRATFLDYLKKFGFDEITEIDLPDEIEGSIKTLERKNAPDIDLATASFGQGIAITSIELIRAFSAFANGGFLMRPYLNVEEKPKTIRSVMSENTAVKVTSMMESAVSKAGVASMPQYRLAGKTGTAQIADLKKGGYLKEYIHTFVGFGPVSNPKFVALLKVERPRAAVAALTVVPAFKELAQFILSYYNIPPDKINNQQSAISNQ